jgi:predicted SprT family Zn-dependent metalloprotease
MGISSRNTNNGAGHNALRGIAQGTQQQDASYADGLAREMSLWARRTVFSATIHSVLGNFGEWLEAHAQWIDDPQRWRELNLAENSRIEDSTLRFSYRQLEQKDAENHSNDVEKISLEEKHFSTCSAIYDPENEKIYLNREYFEAEKIPFESLQSVILHETAHHLSMCDDRDKLGYDFTQWKSLYDDLAADRKLPSVYGYANPAEGYAELFQTYWGAAPGYRRFRTEEYSDDVLRAIGADRP